MADAAIRFNAQAFKETFLDGAEGDALTALVDDRYNIQRNAASEAEVSLTFTRTSGGAGFTYDAGSIVGTEFDEAGNTILFVLDADVVFPNASNGPISGTATAQATGRNGNAAAGTVTRLVDQATDTTMVVTNAATAGGGNDVESDPELRTRARNFWITLRRGTLGALEFGARQVASVRISRAIEDEDTGLVTLVVTDSDGNSTLQMVADVETEIENWRAAGSIVQVVGGQPLVVNVTGTLTVFDGVDATVLAPLVIDAITARMRKLRQGELLYLDTIKAAGIAVDPDGIEALPLTLPTDTVTPLSFQVIRPGVVAIT